MVMDVCVCGEQRYIWHTGADQSMEEVGWREREREEVLLCRAGSYYTDKKCSVMKKKQKRE